ncbi:hypothetical protein PHYPSEUDO_010667 [Phytophthora pseudosyringae]|uniref:Uncharacterized protein n=1 Tax=Phytophthora pseudosyringae TaxID=221518 RepID=A0A8T1W5U4_9STRA|nr:hypothetical protein PHYPSEUDO_010667 [Phytophthora pseudosyringae]
MSNKLGARSSDRIGSETAPEAAKPPPDGADVVVGQFARELTALLQLTREKQAKQVTSESFGGARDDVANAHQEVACFGDVAQKLVPLVGRLLRATPDQLNAAKKAELLLTFGDKFYHAQEFQAASMFFYEKLLLLLLDDNETDESSARPGGAPLLERVLASVESPSSRLESQAYIRGLFGVAMSCFHVQKRSDALVRNPGRLEKMVEALTFLRLGMESAVAAERSHAGQFSWLTLNGSVLVYSIAKPLQALGFSKEVVAYLKWSLLALGSAVALSTTKHVLWRLQLGSAICDCYEDLALQEAAKAEQHLKAAVACAAYLQQAVQRLRSEEELDMPLPVHVQRVLAQAETTSAMLVLRVKAAAAHEPPTRSALETAFPIVQDQLRAAMDVMETLSRRVKQQRGGQGTFTLVASASTPPPPANEALVAMFDFVMEMVTPKLKLLVGEGESESSPLDPADFPVSFHLALIRHCFQLAKPGEHMSVLTRSVHARLETSLVAADAEMIKCLLELYGALHDVQQSWSTWEALSEEERVQCESKAPVTLPVSGGTIPASTFLTRLAMAMQGCVFHGDGAISRTNEELMASVALQMWREIATPMLKELDATEPSQLSKPLVRLTCELLLAIHFTFTAVKFQDLLLHARVCLRLATLLAARGKARRGSQVVRQCLERIDSRRSELVNLSSHFHAAVHTDAGLGSTPERLSHASFSCAVGDHSGSADSHNARDRVGVRGTGSQLGGLSQDQCCVQVDLLLLLYRLELQAATMVDALPLSGTKASTGGSLTASMMLFANTEVKLGEECHQNGYARVLLNIQRLAHPHKSVKERRTLADESFRLLEQVETQEEKLRHQLTPSWTESAVPAAPVVVSRSSSAITVQVVAYHPFVPSLRKKHVAFYMVFAKSAGVGTAVSLNSNQLAGTATPVYPPRLNVTISGLLPNESYVFAVAAFDSKHELIHCIGETSDPVVALNPLPLQMCYGYLAKACDDAQLAGRASQAAKYLYNAVVSRACAARPSWMANPFYRQALQRDVVAQFPVPILNLCIQALVILCHDEPGDPERDGKLDSSSSDLDAQPLTATQTKALEGSRKVSMAIEIACATDNLEAIRVLCFKGYRLLLPLLHLKGGCDGLTFAALVTFYQALHVIPSAKWDADTRSICARVGFELFRVAQEANGDVSRVTLPLLLTAGQRLHEPDQAHSDSAVRNEEDSSFREVVALFKLATSTQIVSTLPPDTSTPVHAATAVVSPRGAGTKGAAAAASKDKTQSNTPQATPRSTGGESGEAEVGGKLPSLSELLQSEGNDLSKVFTTLEQQSSSDRRAIEFASKICGAVLAAGNLHVAQMDKLLSSLKVAGRMSSRFRATLVSLGGISLLPEVKDAPPADEASPLSARAEQEVTTSETPPLETIPEADVDDDYLYLWCGELFFIQSVLLYRKIAMLCATISTVKTANGPDTEDCTYELPHGGNKDDEAATSRAKGLEVVPGSGAEPQEEDSPTEEDDHGGVRAAASEDNRLAQLVGELLEKSAACCKLFRLAKCWQGLQAAAQQLWNAVWLAWVAPSQVSASPTRLAHLSGCVDALLDMMDLVVNGAGDQHATSSTEQPMTLSTVVYAATNVLNVDQTWFARLMAYSLRAFCSVKDWKSIVQKGSRYHSLCGSSAEGSRFSEHNFPVLIYAQQQIVNHQEALLTAAEEELSAYITAFQGQEAKKKKKKSRLVVEEVLSPEEITFRATKQEMGQRIQGLVTERDLERGKLADLSEIYDGLSKASSKSLQALTTCHQLVENYRRLGQRGTDARQKQEELTALRRQVLAAYNRCVLLARQKRQKRVVCQALHEAGDFHLATGDLKAAVKSWLESLDNTFTTLNVGASWRQVLAPPADHFLEGNTNKDKLAGDEFWVGLQCCSVLSKLVMHASGVNLHKAVDYALMAAAIFTRFYGCSAPHPTKCFLFGSYRVLGQLWPGRKMLTDPDRVFDFSLGIMLVLVPDVLLQYEHQYASTAMPVIAGYEYVAESCLEDANHVANARRLRVEALVHCGRFHEAFQVLMRLLRGGGNGSGGAPELDAVVFHDRKALLDESNRAALNWFISFHAEQTHADLKKHYAETLVVHILAVILHLAVAMARHESRYDRDAAIARSAAKKMAHALLSLVKPGETATTPAQPSRNAVDGGFNDEEEVTATQTLQSTSWEELQLHRIRADFHLQLSYLAFDEGDWNASKASTVDAIGEYNAIRLGSDETLHLELDQQLKFSLVLSQGTFLARCRSQAVACCLAQTHYRTALETARVAIEETRATGEEHLRQHLEMQRLQAAVFLGEREKTERELVSLCDDALAAHTSASLTYVRTLQALSSILRSKALLSSHPSALIAVYEHLSEAEQVLDGLLEHDGWIGVGSDHTSPTPQFEKRLSLYRPAIPEFVQVHADLAQVLLECPLNLESESIHARQERALRSVGNGIRALEHTTRPMSATKARLLLLKGVLLSKALHSTTTQLGADSSTPSPLVLDEEKLKLQLEECAGAFTGCIKSSIEGGYDRQLVRLALLELVDLFGQKLLPSDEDAHVQAAFHYLNLAVEVQKHESVLFDTLELQNGTLTSVEKLPASVCASINAQFEAEEEGSVSPPTNAKAPDVGATVNYFVRLLRMQHILPVSTAALQDACALLHSFLVQNHSVYARLACLTDLPPVPSTDPEIRAGLVCALWGQDLAPAIGSAPGESTHNTKLTFYFTLGTTKVSIAESSPAAGNNDAMARMEKFASSPLLSKCCNLDRQCVQHLKTALGTLRTQMEDEDSLLIDRNAFSKTFHLTLREIQQLFRGAAHSREDARQDHVRDEVRDIASAASLLDAFGNAVAIECTLEVVRRLEDLFSINKGANVADNELCYFLRDLLD